MKMKMVLSQYNLASSSSSSLPAWTVTTGTRRVINTEAQKQRCFTKCDVRTTSLRQTFPATGLEHVKGHPMKCALTRKTCIHAADEQFYAAEPEPLYAAHFFEAICKNLDVFYRFTRPYALVGTIIGVTSMCLLPLQSVSSVSPAFILELLKALVAAVSVHIYIQAANQIYDIETDKINKPSLPLASGEYSKEQGIAIGAISCILSLAIAIRSQSPPLLSTIVMLCIFGSAYSVDLPYLRWKKNAFLAAAYIIFSRAILYQIGFFLHMQRVLGRPPVLSKAIIFATIFMCFYTAVISFVKDIPDAEGDSKNGTRSLSIRIGPERVFSICIRLLLIAYGIAMLVGASSSNMVHKLVAVVGHGLLAGILWFQAKSTNVKDNSSTQSFYMFLWKLYYAEYFLVHFMH